MTRENVSLTFLIFIVQLSLYPHKHTDKSIDDKKPVDSYFLQTLREICGHMCDMDGVDGVDPSECI